MKVKNFKKVEYFFIELDQNECTDYRRSVDGGKDDWEMRIGEIWEGFNDEDGEIERLLNDELIKLTSIPKIECR